MPAKIIARIQPFWMVGGALAAKYKAQSSIGQFHRQDGEPQILWRYYKAFDNAFERIVLAGPPLNILIMYF
jgi:hypothetical protein